MKKYLLHVMCGILLAHLFLEKCDAQPYIDVINIRYAKSPDAGFFQHNKNETELNYLNVSTTLPVLFHNKKDALIFSPFFEQWSTRIAAPGNFNKYHYGLVLPVSLLKSIANSKWTILLTPIVRMNDISINSKSKYQFGGALLANHKNANGKLTYKIGVYMNGDFFGLFAMPLLGIDWQINNKTNLFGVLPGNLTLEHQASKKFYYGATFRAITNSYADSGKKYFRIDENQLGIFADYYLTKNIVLNLEAGHSLFRMIHTGTKNEMKTDWQANDNVYLKLAIAYRLRLR